MSNLFSSTGTMFYRPMLDDPPLVGLFLCSSGSINIMTQEPCSGSLEIEEYKSALNVITYLLYALDQPAWFAKYDAHETQLEKIFQQEVQELERKQRRSHLRIISGGKKENKNE